eukprot:4501292-Heterocapsa_arctica.AAC.1
MARPLGPMHVFGIWGNASTGGTDEPAGQQTVPPSGTPHDPGAWTDIPDPWGVPEPVGKGKAADDAADSSRSRTKGAKGGKSSRDGS